MTVAPDEYLTVAEAADSLKVSTSSLRRWIKQGSLPAYRLGQRRILLRREDLNRLISPTHRGMRGPTFEEERRRLSRPLTAAERERALAALEAARRFSAELLERHGGVPFPDSVDLIREMREERTRQLS